MQPVWKRLRFGERCVVEVVTPTEYRREAFALPSVKAKRRERRRIDRLEECSLLFGRDPLLGIGEAGDDDLFEEAGLLGAHGPLKNRRPVASARRSRRNRSNLASCR